MQLSTGQLAEAFSRHQFALVYEYLADAVQWNLIGGDLLEGKATVIRTCEQSAEYLTGVVTTFKRFRTVVGQESVVVESEADYTDAGNARTTVASCDIYDFVDSKLVRITSYTVQLGDSSDIP